MAFKMNEAARILHFLQRGEPDQKAAAAKEAGQFVLQRSYFPEALPILIELLEQEATPRIAEEAAWALWKFDDLRAVEVLLSRGKESPHASVRAKCIRSLGLLEAQESLNYFRQVAATKNKEPEEVVAAMAFALGYFKDASLAWLLKKLLSDKRPLVRKEACISLGRFLRRDPKCLPPQVLRKLKRRTSTFWEKSEPVRAEAAIALSYSSRSSG